MSATESLRPRRPKPLRPFVERLEDRVVFDSGLTGGGQAFDHTQPSLAVNYIIATQGIFPSQNSGGFDSEAPILGEVTLFAGNYAPGGWAFCDGRLLSISQNQTLFALLGTYYGGNGSTTFALPDLRGRAVVEPGQGPGLTNHPLAQSFGTESVTLSSDQLPSHSHGLAGGVSGATGGGQAFGTTQPSLALHSVIAQNGLFPHFAGIHLFAGNFAPNASWYCDGRLLSISQNQALFALLGTIYGGNGTTHFALPDLRGRVAVGAGQGQGLTSRPLGEPFGAETVTPAETQLPAHAHSLPGGGTTSPAGGGQVFSNSQPSLATSYIIATQGIFPSPSSSSAYGGDSAPYIGQIRPFAGNYFPSGWLPCDGGLLSISQNQALFSILGTMYGGNGTTHFALPDLRGRVVVGAGQGPGLTNRSLGEQFGSESHTLSVTELPAHSHTLPASLVTSVLVNGTTAPSAGFAASRVTSLRVTFSTPVASLDPGAFSLTRGAITLTSGGTVAVSGLGTSSLTLSFPGLIGVESGSLADGIWTLSTDLTKVHAAGGTGTGTTVTNNIRRLFGDGNGDGLVNLADFGLFGATFGKGSAAVGFNPAFDHIGDGTINLTDFGAFGQRFGKGL